MCETFELVISDIASSLALRPKHSRGLTLDVEPSDDPGAFKLVLRGCDKAVVGRTKDPAKAAKVWNDETGAPRPITLAIGSNEELSKVQQELLEFYSSDKSFSERILAMSDQNARDVLLLLLPIFGARPMNRNGWRVGQHAHDAREAQRRRWQERLISVLLRLQNHEVMALAGAGAPREPLEVDGGRIGETQLTAALLMGRLGKIWGGTSRS